MGPFLQAAAPAGERSVTDSLATLLDAYTLTPPIACFALPGGVNNAVIGIHTGAGDFVLKTIAAHKTPAALRYEHELLRWLAGQTLSFAVPAPVPTRTGATFAPAASGYNVLLPLLPGRRPDHRDPRQIELVGAALAELHGVLAHFPPTPHPSFSSYGALTQVHPLIADPLAPGGIPTPAALGLPATATTLALFDRWRSELAALHEFSNGPYAHLPRQVIHGDFAPSQTLYADGRITAILDFEFAGPDVRAMDVAAGLVFSMRLWENPEPLVNAAAFCRGYGNRQRLIPAEIDAIPWLMRLRNAVSAIWWFGRDLAAGRGECRLDRVQDMQTLVDWLRDHEQALLETIVVHSASRAVCDLSALTR